MGEAGSVVASVAQLRAVFLGAPGAGKGTQAQQLAATGGALHVSTGDMLREHKAKGTPLGKQAQEFMDSGRLVPDSLIIAMVKERIAAPDAQSAWILDGFPRTLPQAEALDASLGARGLTHVVSFAIPQSELLARLSGRRTCGNCGAIWHVQFKPTTRDGICDKCGGRLVHRPDDHPDAVSKRLEVFRVQTEPLLVYYRQRGILVELDANRPPEQVFDALKALVAKPVSKRA